MANTDLILNILERIDKENFDNNNDLDFVDSIVNSSKSGNKKTASAKDESTSLSSVLSEVKNNLLKIKEELKSLEENSNGVLGKLEKVAEHLGCNNVDKSLNEVLLLSSIIKIAQDSVDEAKEELEGAEGEEKGEDEEKKDTGEEAGKEEDVSEEEGSEDMLGENAEGGEDAAGLESAVDNMVEELLGEAESEVQEESSEGEGETPPPEEEKPVEGEEGEKSAQAPPPFMKKNKGSDKKDSKEKNHDDKEKSEYSEEKKDDEILNSECCEEDMKDSELDKKSEHELNYLESILKNGGVEEFAAALDELNLSTDQLKAKAKGKFEKIAASKIAAEIEINKLKNKNLGKNADSVLKKLIKTYITELIS